MKNKKQNTIIFGNASYVINNLIRIRDRKWDTTLPNGKAWKKPYVAALVDIDQHGNFDRIFLDRIEVNVSGVDATEWELPENTLIEFGWVYDNLDSHDANTHFLAMIGGKWIEVSKKQVSELLRG